MKVTLALLLSIVFGFASGLHAQAPASRPLPARQAAILSPEIHEDRSVTFRLRAPQAKEVAVRGQWAKQPLPLARGDDDGVWSVTSDPIAAGVWEYSFGVDGLNLLDPANPALKPQREPGKSILHIVGTPPNPWDFQDVPHGAVHQHSFLSKSLGRVREVWVYTPPGYESDAAAKYPLLVLQHGSGDNHKTWVEHGKAHWILDSLIAAGKAKPMIVLMLDGHPQGQVPREDADKRATSLAAFQRELFEDALPLVEARYRVTGAREQRAIAGLSMGGWQALTVGLNNLDRFAWIGSFSGAAEEATLAAPLADATGTNSRLKLLWIACGKADFLRERNEALIAALQKSGIQHDWQLTEGDHSWPVWRRYLVEFAPKLFPH